MSENLKPNWIKTNNTLVINYPGQNFTLTKDNSNFEKALNFLKAEDYSSLRNLLSPVYEFLKYAGGQLVLKNNKLFLEDDEMPISEAIAKKIKEFSSEGLPFAPLVNFWKKIKNNPDPNSVEQLYTFLERNHLPITPEGNLIAFKGVLKSSDPFKQSNKDSIISKYGKDNVFWSSHVNSKDNHRIANIIGQSVYMDRKEIDSNPNSHCSYGLHVGAYSYASTFVSGSDSAVLEVEIDPEHAVSVPNDCNCQKMRVCEYKILGLVKKENITKHIVDEYQQKANNTPEDESGSVSKTSNNSTVFEKCKAIIVDKLYIDPNDIDLDSEFDRDLGADSLDMVELIMEAEKEFNIAIPDEAIEDIKTVGEAVKVIESRLEDYTSNEVFEEEEEESWDENNDFESEGNLEIDSSYTAKQMVQTMIDYYKLQGLNVKTLKDILNNKNSLKNKKSLINRLIKIGLSDEIEVTFS